MAQHNLSNHFGKFFDNINPSLTFERIAASQYNTIKGLIEDPTGLASALSPTCFLQGSYKHQTAIHSINDVDIIVLCRSLKFPGDGVGKSWGRHEIFDTIAAPLLNDGRYKNKVRYHQQSMCIKLDLGIKVEILPVVYASESFGNENAEPFYLYRPENSRWEVGYARQHRQYLSDKNSNELTQGNFVPVIKVIKHLRTLYAVDAVSFHIESLFYRLPDALFQGSVPNVIESVLRHLSKYTYSQWYALNVKTPCADRDIFTGSEWTATNWSIFHNKAVVWYEAVKIANQQVNPELAILAWQAILGEAFFPREVNL